jgi:hypothetical protein
MGTKSKVRVNKYYKKWKMVNGKMVENTEMRNTITNKGEYIRGHQGKNKVNIRRTFKTVKGKFPWNTRKAL